ncbi:MAG: DNA mismatch repair endonuclease MutL [Erysipelotrichaceae bacterium]|nr:DNA mismatch repair endonuclease MutL [Erysipelotrichaceae bacterium]
MSKIQIMDMNLANKIAAGEVVEKTMNVVKELVENSIDAGATTIKIELIDSGVKEIKVIDDGCGMDENDATLAFSRHATSKLKTLDDLFNINSLGFRGEALPSIASVSNIVLKTSNEKTGTMVVVNGGNIESVKSCDLKKGTTIIVKDLFYNTPVRLKYLKSLYTELANISDYVNKMALSYPNIKFVLVNNEKELLNTNGSGDLLKTIFDIYGVVVANKMMYIENMNNDYKISGYISYPELTKSNRGSITLLVNNRVVKNYEIVKAILEAYHTFIPKDRFPYIVLNIEVDPFLVDVNVHPTKMEVKFSKEDSLTSLIMETIDNKLNKKTLIPKAVYENVEDKYYEDDLKVNEDLFGTNSIDDEKEETLEKPKLEELTFDFSVNEEKEEYESEVNPRIKELTPIGIVHGTYIICENPDGMFIIDQHAAAERINYEKYYHALSTHSKNTIDVLIPYKIELPTNEYIILEKNFNILDNLGFKYEEFGNNTLIIRSHPTWLPKYAILEAIRKIIDIIIKEEDFNEDKFNEKVSITLSCKMSIKAGDVITMPDITYLINELRHTKNPFTCPHGRPTIITYTKYDLEKLFKRAM